VTTLSFPRSEIRVLLLEGISQTAAERFRQAGYTRVDTLTGALTGSELHRALADAHVVGIRSRTQLDAVALNAARRLFAIGCFCIGTNQVDIDAAQAQGIPVFNAPYSNTRSVAELVLAEAILLLRRIPEKNMRAHRGAWSKTSRDSYEARGKTLGIIGYGHIGSQVGVLAEALGMQVLFHDVEPKLALGNARAASSLGDLLRHADVVTLHVPEIPSTARLLGAAELDAMRPGSALINASRGNVVVIDALVERLRSGHLSGAALDVFPTEPKSNDDRFESPLVDFDNVLLTPHVGGSTEEAQENIGREVADKLIRYSDNGSTLSAVNFPEVSLPEHAGSRRLLHIHENRPGVLSAVNERIARSEANIDAQYLQTLPQLGYVVVDLDCSLDQARLLRSELAAIPGTLRTRILH
jgi:D-3-phosphoglycerate dehydrogenase